MGPRSERAYPPESIAPRLFGFAVSSFARATHGRSGLHRSADEAGEQRMRASGTRLQLGMELTTDEPGMRLQLDHLYQRSIRRKAAQIQTVLDEGIAILVVDFIAMSVTLADLWHCIDLRGQSALPEPARIRTQSHRAAHVRDVLLIFHQRDNSVSAFRRKFAGMTIGHPDNIAREFDDCRL